MSDGVRFAKGHGTENDFVLVYDPEGDLELTPERVVALCDRRAGVGGDGLLRVVRTAAVVGQSIAAAEATTGASDDGEPPEWFMDYRNADGSVAQMCGNGLRVFAAYLLRLGVVDLADTERADTEPADTELADTELGAGQALRVGTRAGTKTVRREGDWFAADLGPWRVVGGRAAALAGSDVTVDLNGGDVALPGLSIDVGNPHVVVALPDLGRLRAADLTASPVVRPAPSDGTNVELIVPRHDGTSALGHLVLRVHERGVGETRSCGTGAVAAALAARVWGGEGAPHEWRVDVPGGRLLVRTRPASVLSGESVELVGPATIVATGVLDPGWLPPVEAPPGSPIESQTRGGAAGALTVAR